MNYERNQPSFSVKFKTENEGLYTDKTLTLILPDLFIIQCACNARDPGLIPGLGRSAVEGIDYPLQYSWAFLVS